MSRYSKVPTWRPTAGKIWTLGTPRFPSTVTRLRLRENNQSSIKNKYTFIKMSQIDIEGFNELFEDIAAIRNILMNSVVDNDIIAYLDEFKEINRKAKDELDKLSKINHSNQNLERAVIRSRDREAALQARIDECIANEQQQYEADRQRYKANEQKFEAENAKAIAHAAALEEKLRNQMDCILAQQCAGGKRAGSPLQEQRKRTCSEREAQLQSAQNLLYKAQQRLDDDQTRLQAEMEDIEEGRLQVTRGRERLVARRQRLAESEEDLEIRELRFARSEDRLRAGETELRLQRAAVHQQNHESIISRMETLVTEAVKQLATGSSKSAETAQTELSALHTSVTEFRDMFKASREDQTLAPEEFWQRAVKPLADQLRLIPVLRVEGLTWNQVSSLFIKFLTYDFAIVVMSRFLEESPTTWHCVEQLISTGLWDDEDPNVVGEKCQFHDKRCVIATVTKYDSKVGPRNALHLHQ